LIGPNQAKQKAVTLNHLQQAENAQAIKGMARIFSLLCLFVSQFF
jgi:hypothetical protein